VQGAIDFIHANQAPVDAYLVEEEQRHAETCRQNPLPPGLAERIRKHKMENGLKSA
jgi:hypothetical protein